MICKICGGEMDYLGYADGGGDFGVAICRQWRCPACDWEDEDGCWEPYDGEDAVESWERQAVDEIIAEEEAVDDDDDTGEFDAWEFYDEPIDPPF